MKENIKVVFSLFVIVATLLTFGNVVVFAADPMQPAVDKETVVICSADEPPSMTSANHAAVASEYVNRLTYSGLFRFDENVQPVLDMAESYDIEKDENGQETIWIFHLRKGIKFSNGMDFTAEDVKATLEFARKQPEVVSYTKSYDQVEVIDDYTVKITTGDSPSATLPYDLAHHANNILPKALIDEGHDFNQDPVGAGPYKLVEWKKSEEMIFEANEYYYGEEPAIKKIIWKIIPEGVNRTIALQSGDVDYIIDLDSSSYETIENDENIKIWNEPSASHNWLGINNRKAPFDDVNVRKALNAAINKEDVIEVALNGIGMIPGAQAPFGLLGYTDEGMKEYSEYNPEKAMEYLEAWGGDPSSIELDIICSNETKRRAAEVIQANLADIGINATLSSMDLATYMSETASGNFTGFIGGYTAFDMMAFLNGVFHSSNVGGSNKTGMASPELDDLIEKALHTIDDKEREEILTEAVVFLNNYCPQVPLWQENILSAYKASLEGVQVSAYGEFRIEEWSWK